MRRLSRSFVLLGLAAAAACSDSRLTSPTAPVPPDLAVGSDDREASGRVTVLTQNMYVGADVDAVIGALATPDPGDDFPALLAAIQTLTVTDFPARARAFARTIERERPHLVGLQEVSVIDLDLTPLGLPVVIHLDFLETLKAECLAARGLHYEVAAKVKNITAAPLPGVLLVDYDALLVDARRVTLGSAQGRTFAANLGAVAPGVVLLRGWVSADVTIGGKPFSVASTHLESGNAPGLAQLRAAQALELVGSLRTERPTILMGDLNDQPESAMYQVLAEAGFVDVWKSLRRGSEGFTCCNLADLSNPKSAMVQRIDYVWARLGSRQPKGEIKRIGVEAWERVEGVAGKIWPSDHAGLLAAVR